MTSTIDNSQIIMLQPAKKVWNAPVFELLPKGIVKSGGNYAFTTEAVTPTSIVYLS